MKAKIKSTREIVDAQLHRETERAKVYKASRVGTFDYVEYFFSDELDFNLDPAPQKQRVTVEGWGERTEDGDVVVNFKPLPTSSFPGLKWEDEPRKVKLTVEEV